MSETYHYNITEDTQAGSVYASLLLMELQTSGPLGGIVFQQEDITVNGNTLTITTDTALSSEQSAELSAIVQEHGGLDLISERFEQQITKDPSKTFSYEGFSFKPTLTEESYDEITFPEEREIRGAYVQIKGAYLDAGQDTEGNSLGDSICVAVYHPVAGPVHMFSGHIPVPLPDAAGRSHFGPIIMENTSILPAGLSLRVVYRSRPLATELVSVYAYFFTYS